MNAAPIKGTKVIVGLSGGIDSAVSLLLLKKQGFEPQGLFLKFDSWQTQANSSQKQLRIIKEICQQLKCPFYVLNCSSDFKKQVVDYFNNSLKKGQTPNPCVICNHYFKFRQLIQFALKKKINYVATGHYARINRGAKYKLLRPKDKKKDQSYFLCLLTQSQLKHIIFPLGDLSKKEVVDIAKKNKWPISRFQQSQDFCFLGPSHISSYLEKNMALNQGNIVDIKGNVLGKHNGLYFYTLGQRKRIGLANGPYWVVGFDYQKNNLIVSSFKNDQRLFKKEIIVSHYHFISGEKFPAKKKFIKVKAKLRYQSPLSSARIYPWENKLRLVFDKPQRAPTPGQFAVFYQGDVCLGGGSISDC